MSEHLHLIDLDELVLKCRDKTTKGYIQEAVSCYRAGAFRSCIVSTWNAIAFDYLHKLRELELTGDGQAKEELAQFEKLRSEKKYKELWQFEIDIPKCSQEKFEFISWTERQDLERLCDDRSRCAHPSMQSIDEPFQATPESARYHMRNAITHLLQHPPVQGKAALQRIWNEIKSESFPCNVEEAIITFKSSYLARARESLIKSIVVGLTKSLLTEPKPYSERNRMYAALKAILTIHYEKVQTIIANKLSDIINSVSDSDWDRVFLYLYHMKTWDSLNDGQKIKAKNYLNNIDNLINSNPLILITSLGIPYLQEKALQTIKKFEDKDLTSLIILINNFQEKLDFDIETTNIINRYQNYAINHWINSGSHASARSAGEELLLVSTWLTKEQLQQILQNFYDNYQIYNSWGINEMMTSLFENTIKLADFVKDTWLLVRERIVERNGDTDLVKLINDKFCDVSLEDNSDD